MSSPIPYLQLPEALKTTCTTTTEAEQKSKRSSSNEAVALIGSTILSQNRIPPLSPGSVQKQGEQNSFPPSNNSSFSPFLKPGQPDNRNSPPQLCTFSPNASFCKPLDLSEGQSYGNISRTSHPLTEDHSEDFDPTKIRQQVTEAFNQVVFDRLSRVTRNCKKSNSYIHFTQALKEADKLEFIGSGCNRPFTLLKGDQNTVVIKPIRPSKKAISELIRNREAQSNEPESPMTIAKNAINNSECCLNEAISFEEQGIREILVFLLAKALGITVPEACMIPIKAEYSDEALEQMPFASIGDLKEIAHSLEANTHEIPKINLRKVVSDEEDLSELDGDYFCTIHAFIPNTISLKETGLPQPIKRRSSLSVVSPCQFEKKAPTSGLCTQSLRDIVLLDLLTMNTDRHSGNVLFQTNEDGKLVIIPIDHGCCFPTNFQSKSTFVWDQWITNVELGNISEKLCKFQYEEFEQELLSQLPNVKTQLKELVALQLVFMKKAVLALADIKKLPLESILLEDLVQLMIIIQTNAQELLSCSTKPVNNHVTYIAKHREQILEKSLKEFQ